MKAAKQLERAGVSVLAALVFVLGAALVSPHGAAAAGPAPRLIAAGNTGASGSSSDTSGAQERDKGTAEQSGSSTETANSPTVALQTLIDRAVQNSQRLEEQRYSRLGEYYEQIDPTFKPELDLILTQRWRSRTPRTDVINAPDGFPDQIITGAKSNLSAGITAEVPLVESGPARLDRKIDQWDYARSKMRFVLEREDLVQEVSQLYYRINIANRKLAVLEDLRQVHRNSVEWYQKRVEEGRELSFRLKEAEYRLALAEHETRAVELSSERALGRLERLTGMRLRRDWFNIEPQVPEFTRDPDLTLIERRVNRRLEQELPGLRQRLDREDIGDGLEYSWLIPSLSLSGELRNRGDFSRFESGKVIGEVALTAHFQLWDPEGEGRDADEADLRQRQLDMLNDRSELVRELADSWFGLVEDSHWLNRVYPEQRAWLSDERRVVRLRFEENLGSFGRKQLKRRQTLELELSRLERKQSALRSMVGLEYWLGEKLTALRGEDTDA